MQAGKNFKSKSLQRIFGTMINNGRCFAEHLSNTAADPHGLASAVEEVTRTMLWYSGN
jgi:hypothetical protein